MACLMPTLENLGPRIRGPEPTDLSGSSACVPGPWQGEGRMCVRAWEGCPSRIGDSRGGVRAGYISQSSNAVPVFTARSPTRQLNSACHQDMGLGYLSSVYMYFNLQICQTAPLAPAESPAASLIQERPRLLPALSLAFRGEEGTVENKASMALIAEQLTQGLPNNTTSDT